MNTVIAMASENDLQGSSVPEWVHLLPSGHANARDGRTFVVRNPQAILDAFTAGGIDLPIEALQDLMGRH